MSYALAVTIIGPAVSQIQNELKIGDVQVGFILTCQFGGFILTLLFGGYLIDKYGIRLVQIIGQFTLCLGLLFFSQANSYLILIICAPIIGISGALIEISTNTTVATIYKDTRSSSLNLLHVFFGVGALIGPFFSGCLISRGIHWSYVYLSIFSFSLLPFFLFLPQRFPEKTEGDKIDISLIFKVMKNRLIIYVGIISLLYAGVEFAINTFVVSYMEKTHFLSKLTASSFLTLFWFFVAIGRLLCIPIGKKIKEEDMLWWLSLFSVVFFLLFLLSRDVIFLGINISLSGLFFSGIFAILIAIGVSKFPHHIGTVSGVVILFAGVGMALVPYIAGVISDMFSIRIALFVMWGFLVLMSALSYLLKAHRKKI